MLSLSGGGISGEGGLSGRGGGGGGGAPPDRPQAPQIQQARAMRQFSGLQQLCFTQGAEGLIRTPFGRARRRRWRRRELWRRRLRRHRLPTRPAAQRKERVLHLLGAAEFPATDQSPKIGTKGAAPATDPCRRPPCLHRPLRPASLSRLLLFQCRRQRLLVQAGESPCSPPHLWHSAAASPIRP